MKTSIQTLSILAITASLSFGEEAAPKPAKVKATPEEMFKKIDANADNALSLDEFKASPKGKKDPVKAEEMFKKIDTDSNGGLSLEEFKAGAPAKADKGKGKVK